MDRALKWEKEKALESLKERRVKEMQSELGCKRQMECVELRKTQRAFILREQTMEMGRPH